MGPLNLFLTSQNCAPFPKYGIFPRICQRCVSMRSFPFLQAPMYPSNLQMFFPNFDRKEQAKNPNQAFPKPAESTKHALSSSPYVEFWLHSIKTLTFKTKSIPMTVLCASSKVRSTRGDSLELSQLRSLALCGTRNELGCRG